VTMKIKTMIKDQDGATAVEFAIILPLLILLVFGIIEISLLLYNKQVITNATREGARLGVVVRVPRYSDQDIKNEIINYAQNYLVTFGSDTFGDDNIIIYREDPTPTFGDELEVEVNYDYEFLVLKSLLGSIPLQATSTMRME
jgi:Flp pilus assembly pilin Flp